jgi:arylformamidase
MDQWIDISVPVRPGMAQWPGDAVYELRRVGDMSRGDVANGSAISMSVHTGTHIDAPLHFVRDGLPIEAMPLDAMTGRTRVIAIEDGESIKAPELQRHSLKRGERVLCKTRNSPAAWQQKGFAEDFVHIRVDAARHLVQCGVRTVGIDYLSVGGYQRDGVETHQILLGAGLWLIEGLNLSEVRPGDYEMICLPLKLAGAEAAPARALLRLL